jgi:hypothetical protein
MTLGHDEIAAVIRATHVLIPRSADDEPGTTEASVRAVTCVTVSYRQIAGFAAIAQGPPMNLEQAVQPPQTVDPELLSGWSLRHETLRF